MENLGTRTTRYDTSPIIDADGETAAFNSCFQISTGQISPRDPFATTFKFNKDYFVHSVLLVQDVGSGILGSTSTENLDKKYATQWDVHIGDSPDWRDNPKCTLTPLLAADYRDSTKNWSEGVYEGTEVPAYGFVKYCNMSGQYVTFVAHGVPSISITVCTVSINGNRYIRDISPETIVEILAGETQTMQVEHIRPEFS